jgi:hypothetical protein
VNDDTNVAVVDVVPCVVVEKDVVAVIVAYDDD